MRFLSQLVVTISCSALIFFTIYFGFIDIQESVPRVQRESFDPNSDEEYPNNLLQIQNIFQQRPDEKSFFSDNKITRNLRNVENPFDPNLERHSTRDKHIHTLENYVSFAEIQTLINMKKDFFKLEPWPNKNQHSKITILLWKHRLPTWSGFGSNPHRVPNYVGQTIEKTCPITCETSANTADAARSQAILYEATHFRSIDWDREPPDFPLKMPNQKWIGFGYEQEEYFTIQQNAKWKEIIDFNMNYQQDQPVPVTFTCNWGGEELDQFLLPPPQKTKEIAAIISNCDRGGANKRRDYLREMMKYIQVDSFGSCEHNIDLPQELEGRVYADHGKAMQNKIKLFRQYKFVLAFENNNVTDYITEKIYNAFQAGAIPVYMGSSTIADWIPGEHSIIRTDQFPNPKTLVDYLKTVSANEELYQQYFEWKKFGLLKTFIEKYKRCLFYNSECRLCRYLADHSKPATTSNSTISRKALSLSANGTFELDPNTSSELNDEFSFVAWIKCMHSNEISILDRTFAKTQGYKFVTYIKPTTQLMYLRFCMSGRCFMSLHPLAPQKWFHVAVTVSMKEERVCFYIYGWLDSCRHHHYNFEKNIPRIRIGNPLTNRTREDLFDEVMIWNIALDAEFINKLSYSMVDPVEHRNLVGYFQFDHELSKEQQVFDGSLYSQHGKLVGKGKYFESITKPIPMNQWVY